MAIRVLDHKIQRSTSITGSGLFTFRPWEFFNYGFSGSTRFIIDWDIIAIATNENSSTTYNNWYIKKWIWDYFPSVPNAKLVSAITISVSSSDFVWTEDSTTGSTPGVVGTLNSSTKTFTCCGSSRIISCAEI